MSNSIPLFYMQINLQTALNCVSTFFLGVDAQQTLNQKDVSVSANNFQITGVYTVRGALV
jgi:hypothetical protein